jgi:hypothetical protein
MKMDAAVKKVIGDLRVADAKTVGEVLAAHTDFKNTHSARVQAQKQLNLLVETGELIRGDGFYAVKGYRGSFTQGSHDRLVTDAIARLILLKLPISVRREVSFPIGLRSDIVALIGKNGQGTCTVVEVANHETPEYLNQKIVAWKHWQGANEALRQLFNVPIPAFTLVVYGKAHPEAMDFETFIKEVQK